MGTVPRSLLLISPSAYNVLNVSLVIEVRAKVVHLLFMTSFSTVYYEDLQYCAR